MELVREGRADLVVKGQVKTAPLLRTALDRERGICKRTLLSHVAVFEIPGFDRLLCLSDSGVVPHPTPMQKLVIIQNAVDVAHALGIAQPRVGILSANSEVHPSRPVGVEALLLARMASDGWIADAIADGPMPLDVAVDAHIARLKGIDGPVAGQADVVIVPSVEAGNIAAKAIQYLGRGESAGLVVGACVPILINSRADDATTRLRSIALAAIQAGASLQ
jgi:phosphate butyryltransferase